MDKRIENAIIIVFAALLFGGGFWAGYSVKKCPDVLKAEIVYRDSIASAKDTMIIKLISGKPAKVRTAKFTDTLKAESKISDSVVFKIDTAVNDCRDTNYYEALKFYPDSFRARATGVVTNNALIDWQFDFQNLKPEVIKIVERTNTIEKKQSLVKLYTGLYGRVAFMPNVVKNYGGGVTLDGVIKDNHMIGVQGGVNSQLQGEAQLKYAVKIRLRK
jgi:hypothetical protein